jgi:enamine deaminase RidA (YjgF/YER057c/UK114 family)
VSRARGPGSGVRGPQTLEPEGWAAPAGYAHGMAATGRIVVTAGQIGWDPVSATFASDDFATQAAQALRNVVAVLRAADAEPAHLVRLTWYVTSRDEYIAARRALGAAYREIVGRHYPAMAVVVVSALIEERAKVEIEGMAVVPG